MGEPLFNLTNLVESINLLSLDNYNVAISTIGMSDKINELMESKFIKYPRLQISLHKIQDREILIPIEKKISYY